MSLLTKLGTVSFPGLNVKTMIVHGSCLAAVQTLCMTAKMKVTLRGIEEEGEYVYEGKKIVDAYKTKLCFLTGGAGGIISFNTMHWHMPKGFFITVELLEEGEKEPWVLQARFRPHENKKGKFQFLKVEIVRSSND